MKLFVPIFITLTFSTNEATLKCPSKFGLFANSNDQSCASFLQCSWGTPYVVKCPSELLYDSQKQTCVWNYEYQCPTPAPSKIRTHTSACS